MTLPLTETKTVTNYHTGQEEPSTTEYFMVRVGAGKAIHLASQTTYSDGKTYNNGANCGADANYQNRRSYRVNADTVTCKTCLKTL